MTDKTRTPESQFPEAVDDLAQKDLAPKELSATDELNAKGGMRANIAGTHNKTADALVANIRG